MVQALRLGGATGVGHSMGGHSLVWAAAANAAVFSALLLIDPVILPPERYGATPPDASFILRRRAFWNSPEEMIARFGSRSPFAAWHPDVLRDYCRFGLLPEGAGYTLACPPHAKASIYAGSNAPEANLYAAIPGIRCPVRVLRADAQGAPGVFDLSASPAWPELASRFSSGRDRLLTGRNHYIPMESPELVAAEIRGATPAPPARRLA